MAGSITLFGSKTLSINVVDRGADGCLVKIMQPDESLGGDAETEIALARAGAASIFVRGELIAIGEFPESPLDEHRS